MGEFIEMRFIGRWEVIVHPRGVDVSAGSVGGEIDIEKAVTIDISGTGRHDEKLLAEVGEA